MHVRTPRLMALAVLVALMLPPDPTAAQSSTATAAQPFDPAPTTMTVAPSAVPALDVFQVPALAAELTAALDAALDVTVHTAGPAVDGADLARDSVLPSTRLTRPGPASSHPVVESANDAVLPSRLVRLALPQRALHRERPSWDPRRGSLHLTLLAPVAPASALDLRT